MAKNELKISDPESDFGMAIDPYEITSTPNDFNIATLFDLIDDGIIKIPCFQRNYVWDKKQASKFIESIILGLPIPQIFLYEKEKNDFLIVDGQQRLLSIYFFVRQRFPKRPGREKLRDAVTGATFMEILADDDLFENFSLTLEPDAQSEHNKLNRKAFDSLGNELRRIFLHLKTIRTVVIKQNYPEDGDSSIYEVFNRLNTGGKNLKPQEIRMNLYYSNFYSKLFEINALIEWRRLLAQKIPDINFKDIEILLRAFAMLDRYEDYKRPMSRFLNVFSKDSINLSDADNEYLLNLFKSFLGACTQLPEKTFHGANNNFNISLFESVFVAVCRPFYKANPKSIVENGKMIDRDSIDVLKSNPEFQVSSQSGLASKFKVQTRIATASGIIAFI
jgi:uncharacterized protein with ParB-like and HNH nuclease domain